MSINQNRPFIIAPSILSANFAKLGEEITSVIAAGADWIHFDVMDNHYVPNLTIGPLVCEAIKPYAGQTPIDVHLMVEPVDNMISMFAKAGADIITFHPEASKHVHRSLKLIQEHGAKAGLVLNPATPLSYVEHILPELDVILLMSVNPGFGGQVFIQSTIQKICMLRVLLDKHLEQTGRHIILEVDGGIKTDNIAQIAAAGAQAFVSGSAIFGQANYDKVIQDMRHILNTIV
jgi:ribulose-phosphate 3-epimerase